MAPFGEWQGEIEHIQSGRRWTFDEVEKYLSVIKVEEQDIEMIENFDNKTGTNASTQSLQNPAEGRK